MDISAQSETLKELVDRFFHIEDITSGTANENFLIRYRGQLRSQDSEQAYSDLADCLRPYNLTPLFRIDNGRQTILLVEGYQTPGASNPWINLLLFVLTIFSVLVTGATYGTGQPYTGEIPGTIINIFGKGWPFAVSMLTILAAHEFGHYLMARHHGIHVTLPYFIPFPPSPFGTLGAFINMKEIPRNRRQLIDISLAGPFAGLIVAIPVLFIGLKLSALNVLESTPPAGHFLQMEGNSLIYLFMKYLAFGQLLPAPISYNEMNPFLYWIIYFFTGKPFPAGGTDVMLNPVAWAGWAGILVTALNLTPVGQLDGGHVVYVLLGKEKMQKLRLVILVLLSGLGFMWNGWWLWAAIIFLLGRFYAEPLDQITELDGKRKTLALLAIVIFILVFTPVPLILIG